jgi:uncharacterized protein (TIRG00374 family)
MASDRGEDLQKRLARPLLWSILAALAIYGASVIISDLDAVGKSIAKLGLAGWAIVLGLSLINYGLRFARWEMYLRRLDVRLPVLRSLAFYLAGFAFTTTPGKTGEAVRSLYLKRHGVAYVSSLAAFFSERLVDLMAMVLLALVAALTFPAYRWPVLLITAVVMTLMPLIHAKPLHAWLDRQTMRLQSQGIRTVATRSVDLLRSSSTLLRSRPLYAGLALAVVAWGAEGVAFQLILHKLDVNATLGLAVGIYSVSVLAGALSFFPGGLGSTEAVMVLLLTLIGAEMPAAVAATLICRLATLWFAVAIGGGVLSMLEIEGRASRRGVSRA